MSLDPLRVVVVPRRIVYWLAAVTIVLVVLSIAGQCIRFTTGHERVFGFIPEFYVDEENNIPTFYGAFLIMASAGLMSLIGAGKRRNREPYGIHWLVLALVFTLVAMDEIAGIHERLIGPLRRTFGFSGILHFAWLVPGIIFVMLLGLSYLRFFLQLPTQTKRGLVIAGVLYFSGVIGMEFIGGWYTEHYSMETFLYSMLSTVEESLEMAGAIALIHVLLTYIGPVGVMLSTPDTPATKGTT